MPAAYSPADIFVLSTCTQRKPDYYRHILTWEQSHNLLYINLQSKFMYFFYQYILPYLIENQTVGLSVGFWP